MSGTSTLSRRSFLILSTAALAACKADLPVLRLSGQTMGTHYNIVAIPSGKTVDEKAMQAAVNAALAEVDTQMSNWNAASEITRINAAPAGETVTLSPALARVMEGAEKVHRASEGRFDVTVGPMIDLWGFGSGAQQPHKPSDADIAGMMGRVGQDRVLSFAGGELTKTTGDAEIYLSAIGKGHGVDRVADVVRSFGVSDFMVEIGGDLYTSGRNPDGVPWQIGIESPVAGDRSLHSVVDVSGLGMATSGDYRNYFEAEGQRYSHIIDPATGRPILHDTVSATVLTEDAMLADAWATAMLVLGRKRGLEIAESEGLAVLFIDREQGAGFSTATSSHFTALQA